MRRLMMTVGVTVALVVLALNTVSHGGPRPPLSFEANRGQTDPAVRYLGRGDGYTVFLTLDGAVLELRRARERAVVSLALVGANPAPEIVGEAELPGRVTYHRIGETPRRAQDAPTYSRVRYIGVYPGVDVVYYGRGRQLEYDFVLAPGARHEAIALAFAGASGGELDESGDLVLQTPLGELRAHRPSIYQDVAGIRRPIPGRYVVKADGRIGLDLDPYDPAHAVVIDPLITYSTYLGGTGDDVISDVAVDAQGNVYVTGATTSPDFPVTDGAYQPIMPGGTDAFVTKLSPTGSVVYSTYLGTDCDDYASGIAVDQAGSAYVTGRVRDGYCASPGNPGVLAAKLGPTGGLGYFFVFGGTMADTSRGQAIAVDGLGHAYVAGLASSTDFPTTPGAFQGVFAGGLTDGFVVKVNPAGTGFVYATYLGGSGHESLNALAIDQAGNAYVAGSTDSRDFPIANAYQPYHRGEGPLDRNAFVAKLNPTGSALAYSTYLGGGYNTAVQGIDVDGAGNAYVTGFTLADDFPTTPGALQPGAGPRVTCVHICSDAFVTKLNAAGTDLVYSTYLYGEGDDSGIDIKVDGAGHAYVVGETGSLYFPHRNAFQSRLGSVFDGFVAKLDPSGGALVYASYVGGSNVQGVQLEGWDTAYAIALDPAGHAYVAGQTLSFDFPVTDDAASGAHHGGRCGWLSTMCGDGFVTMIAPDGPGVTPPTWVRATPEAVPAGGAITATWAGLLNPMWDDRIHLNALGGGGFLFDELAAWPTNGAASGTMVQTVPATLPPGWYELRLLTGNVLTIVARSEPFRVGAPGAPNAPPGAPTALGQFRADGLTVVPVGGATSETAVVLKLAMADPNASDALTPEVEVKPVAAAFTGQGLFIGPAVPYGGAPVQGAVAVTGLTAGTTYHWRARVRDAAGATSAWVSYGGNPETAVDFGIAAPGANLRVTALGNPPAGVTRGERFTVTDTTANQGTGPAGASTTRYYLSADGVRNPGDRLLSGTRSVSGLAAGTASSGSATVTVPTATPLGTYVVLACADDLLRVVESADGDNCLASATTVVVGAPDLVVHAVGNPPATVSRGGSFAATDTTGNQGVVAAGASTTRFYLSADGARNTGDRLLGGRRNVASLDPAERSSGGATLTVPSTTPAGTYFLLACADDLKRVAEGSEANNCTAAATRVQVTSGISP